MNYILWIHLILLYIYFWLSKQLRKKNNCFLFSKKLKFKQNKKASVNIYFFDFNEPTHDVKNIHFFLFIFLIKKCCSFLVIIVHVCFLIWVYVSEVKGIDIWRCPPDNYNINISCRSSISKCIDWRHQWFFFNLYFISFFVFYDRYDYFTNWFWIIWNFWKRWRR